MAQSSIEWTEMTWNPTTGCKRYLLVASFAMRKLCLDDLKLWGLRNILMVLK